MTRPNTLSLFRSIAFFKWLRNHTMYRFVLILSLGYLFGDCFGTHQWSSHLPITSSLYKAVVELPLHTHCDEVASTFLVQTMRYCRGHFDDPSHTCQFHHIYFVVIDEILRVRNLSSEEVVAIRDFYEFWLQRYPISTCPCILAT